MQLGEQEMFKHLKKELNLTKISEPAQSHNVKLSKVFWIADARLHAKEQQRTNSNCCFNHQIGLPTSKIAPYNALPIFGYEMDIIENIERYKDYVLDRAGDERKRARFSDGTVYIHVNHPVLKHYFGEKQERIESSPTREAIALLADSILSIALRQWAKMRIEEGNVEILDMSRKDEEIDLEKDRLEFKYGTQIHQTLLAKFNT